MTRIDTQHFKQKLEEEKATLERELEHIGRKNPSNPKDWEAKPDEPDVAKTADPNEAADRIESFEENSAVLKELETRYNNVLRALKKIEDGTYGICEVSKQPIEPKRLEANPAARTCTEHMEQELELL